MRRPTLPLAVLLLSTPGVLFAGVTSPQLAADPVFPLLGSSTTLSLDGPAGSFWIVEGSLSPARIDLGSTGVLFLNPAQLIPLFAGPLPTGTLQLGIPGSPSFEGVELFVQAASVAGEVQLTNSVALRLRASPATGPRAPLSVATSGDGLVAYVANRDDGTLSIIDAQTDTLRTEVPVGPAATHLPLGPVHVAVDPDNRHAFALNAAARRVTVIDVATDSVAAWIDVPLGTKRVAFDFSGPVDRVYFVNDARAEILVFEESNPGVFLPMPTLQLEGVRPGPVVVLPNGHLVVGNQGSHELERIDPQAVGSPTVQRLPLNRIPHDVHLVGSDLLVSAFARDFPPGPEDGRSQVLRVSTSPALSASGVELDNVGTDYVDLASSGSLLAVTAAGSGSLILASGIPLASSSVVDLAPSQPLATPQSAAFVTNAEGVASKLYVVNYFRETVRAIDLGGPAPTLASEIALAHSGAPRVPFVDLSQEEDGDWLFRSVQFFGGTAATPNPVTCFSCHTDNGSDGLPTPGVNTPAVFTSVAAAPFGWQGSQSNLLSLVNGTFAAHGIFGGSASPTAVDAIAAFLTNGVAPPPSPFLGPQGSLSPSAAAGKSLFEGVAGCTACHAPPLFIPPAPAPATIAAGIGTGLAPINVPSLLGVWSTAPYLHNGIATTLDDVLANDLGGQHGTTSGLTSAELGQLRAYLESL